MSITVRKPNLRYAVIGLFLLPTIPLLLWYAMTPSVVVHYSKAATQELQVVWNTQHRIYRERVVPGQAVMDTGFIFPVEGFFMMFDWWTETGVSRCVDITPKRWSTLHVYLDKVGKIDAAINTSDVMARLTRCQGSDNTDPFEP